MCTETPSLCTLSVQLYVNHVPLRTCWSPILFTTRQQLIVGTWHSSPHQHRDQHLSSQIPKPPWSKQPNASDCGFRLSRFLETSPFVSLCSFPCQLVKGTMSFLYCISFCDIAAWLVTRIRFGTHQFSEQQIDFEFWPSSIVGDLGRLMLHRARLVLSTSENSKWRACMIRGEDFKTKVTSW